MTAVNGAIIYTGNTASYNDIDINHSNFTRTTASNLGSFIYMESDNTPTFAIKLTDGVWEC